jgi:hypothetical protein
MKKALLFIVAAVWTLGAGAQGMARVGEELARPDPVSRARIEVRAAADALEAVRKADHAAARTMVMTYGVSLFRDSSQNARANAYAAQEQFAGMYPQIPVEVSYEIPYFKVEAGCFVERVDAVALLGRVQTHFPLAVIVKQEVPLAEIMEMGKIEPAAVIPE